MATSVPIENMDGFVSWLAEQGARMPSIPGKNSTAVLADKLGLKESTLRKYKNRGTKNLQTSIASSIASYTNLSLEEVIYWITTPGAKLIAMPIGEIKRRMPPAIVEEIGRIKRLVALYPDYTLDLAHAAICTCGKTQKLPPEWVEVVEALKKIKGENQVLHFYESDPERRLFVEKVLALELLPDNDLIVQEVFFSLTRSGSNPPHRIGSILRLLGLGEHGDTPDTDPIFQQDSSTLLPR